MLIDSVSSEFKAEPHPILQLVMVLSVQLNQEPRKTGAMLSLAIN